MRQPVQVRSLTPSPGQGDCKRTVAALHALLASFMSTKTRFKLEAIYVSAHAPCPSTAVVTGVHTRCDCCAGEVPEPESIGPRHRQRWDFIVGSDLVYNEEGCKLLPRVFAQLSGPETVILYAHTKRRFEMLDNDFFDNLQAEGLAVEEVKERWVPAAAASPPSFSSLFPEMRIAVFRIMQRNRR